MTVEIIETAETVFCQIHADYVSATECFECEMVSCSDCVRAYGCDNC
jgi:hypothetical protein